MNPLISVDPEQLEANVSRYFALIRELRQGEEKSVPELMALWTEDGTFEFSGAPPVTGVFKGAMAIAALYKNRLNSRDMPLTLETRRGQLQEASLGVVDTDVTHMRTNEDRVVVGWRTTIGTKEGHGFDVAGSHHFAFEGDKIKSLRVTISPKADQSHLENLKFDDLSITDVGRLSLAAWPVV